MSKPKLSLVIPCYNEENTLEQIVEYVIGLKSETLDLELVIVDDCSKDKSLEKAEGLKKKYPDIIQIAKQEVNQGKGAALRTGFTYATGDYVGIQDADMEYDPKDYLKMLVPLIEGKADVVYGSRYLRTDMRRVLKCWHSGMNKFLTFASNIFTDLDITDMETCYKLFRRDVIQTIAPRLKENRFGFEPEVTSLVAEGHYRVYETSISYNPRTFDEGKKIGWKDGVRALYCIFHYNAHKAPVPMQLIIYFFIGAVSAVVNIASFAALIGAHMQTDLAVVIAFLIAAAVNYLLCIAILFRHKARWSSFGEIMAYLLTLIIMGALDVGVTRGLLALSCSTMCAKVISTIVGFFGNYFLRKALVFPEKKKSAD